MDTTARRTVECPGREVPALEGARSVRSITGRVLVALAVNTALGLASPKAALLHLLFPLLAVVAGWFILEESAEKYLAFTLGLWMLVPELRRLIDFRSVPSVSGPVLLAPYLVSCVPLYHLLFARRRVLDRDAAPMVFASAALVYGACLGLTHYPAVKDAQSVLTWLGPIVSALFVYQNRNHFESLFAAFERTLLWSTLVLGGYGVLQYFLLPVWDADWMLALGNETFGAPRPMELRVFSLINAPQLLGIYLGAGILVSLHSKSRLRLVAVPLGVMALVFTQARSAWISCLAGLVYLVLKGNVRLRLQVLVVAAGSVLAMALAMQNPTVAKSVQQRMDTLSHVDGDVSAVSRVQGHVALVEGLMDDPLGLGFGGIQSGTPASREDSILRNGEGVMQADSSVAAVLIPFGFPGGALAATGFVLLLGTLFLLKAPNGSPAETLKMLSVAGLVLVPLDAVVFGPSGYLYWVITGFVCAARSREREAQAEGFAWPAVESATERMEQSASRS